MLERLKKVYLTCNDCQSQTEFDYDSLLSMHLESDNLTLGNLNQLLDFLFCQKCNSKNFQTFDNNKELLFDSNANVFCEICSLPIPFPRIEVQPNTKKCIDCKDKKETEVDIEPIKFPAVPDEVKGSCKRCKSGQVMVRYNSKDLSFFLSCSRFPKCWWSSNKFFDLLNGFKEN